MDAGRGAVRAAASLIVLVTLASGPAVPAIDLTRPVGDTGLAFGGESELEASIVSMPTADVRLEQGRYGAGTYYLRVPDAVVHVERARGSPRLVYKLNVERLGYVRATVHFVDRSHEGGQVRLELEEEAFEPDRIDQDSYEGVLSVVARTGGDSADTIASRNVTVEVRS